MTISLANVQQRSESMLKTIDGFPFPGTIMPLGDDGMASYDFSEPRALVRVRATSPVREGMVIVGPDGRRFITAEQDQAVLNDKVLYRSLRLFPANRQMKWEREQTIIDPLTQLEKGVGKVDLGMIWVTNEPVQREPIDLTLRVSEQVFRIITNAPLLENDILDNMRIRRIDHVLGVILAELQ